MNPLWASSKDVLSENGKYSFQRLITFLGGRFSGLGPFFTLP